MRELSVEDFLIFRKENKLSSWSDGVYLLGNKTKNKFYVGQSINVKDRIFAHFSGRGNGDVYADYIHDDQFIVRYYEFNKNQFRDINELEYHLIRIYEANKTGYNRQQGNRVRVVV